MSKSKSFWTRPEGITGAIFLMAGVFLLTRLVMGSIGALVAAFSTPLGMAAMLGALGVIFFIALDGKARNLVWYMYKSVMRWITGIFVQIDPIGILKSYVSELQSNLRKM